MAVENLYNKWSILKPNIRKRWGKITEEDLTRISGNKDELVNTLRKRYGYGRAQAELEINNWLLQQSDQPAGA
jgi:uncharacterized protein YjbJ (UPF0337 family)